MASDLQNKAINTIRFLAADAVQTANSGHPGLPMGTAALAFALWTRHLRFNPRNPKWPDRDRFVLSGGHGSMLLYALLHLTGFDVSVDELKNFRQWGSRTPGHPESHLTPGVETTTGPLGQGFGNAVGMAIAETSLAASFNRPGHRVMDHHTYAIVTDGDLMEGVASEAASLAGHLKLGKLIFLYDNNHISIDGSTDLAFTEDRGMRFKAYGWQVLEVMNGNDVSAVDAAIEEAKSDDRPSIIMCKTIIGYGLPNLQGTSKAHGEPPGEEELRAAKEHLGWPQEPWFLIPDDVLEFFRIAKDRGEQLEKEWHQKMDAYQQEYPELARELNRRLAGELPSGWEDSLPEFDADEKGMATRASSGRVLGDLVPKIPEMIGGSADLTPSNKTRVEVVTDYQADNRGGRYLRFGVREHGMGAIINGIGYHGGFIPFGGTFLVFSDYMRPAVRLSALAGIGSIWVYTHDSVALGEDGPTHQPVEHLAALRAIPGLHLIRPADANEVREAWRLAIQRKTGPTALALSRQAVPTLEETRLKAREGVAHGAYILADLGEGSPEIILMSSGSEVAITLSAGRQLAREGHNVRVVSFPSWELFELQDKGYQEMVLPPAVTKRLSVEAGIRQGWDRWIGDEGAALSIEHYGASAPWQVIFQEFGFTDQNILRLAREMLVPGG